MTFTELLVSVTIVMALLGVVAPALSGARQSANAAVCVSNLRELGTTTFLYTKDNDPVGKGGSHPVLPWHLGFDYPGASYSYASEFIYGGFRTTVNHPDFPDSDVFVIPTEARPFNKYLAPGRGGRSPLRPYICPSDRSMATPLLGAGGAPPAMETRYASWEANGNSYAINWYWPFGVTDTYHNEYWDLPCMTLLGTAMLQAKVGGDASEFVLFMEGMMNAYVIDARPPDGSQGQSQLQTLGDGWHAKYSMYCVGFYDGHAEYRFIDTRYTTGSGYDIWPEPDTRWPAGCP
jgi:hypothetical protein